jgi:2'-5' RNA ligase
MSASATSDGTPPSSDTGSSNMQKGIEFFALVAYLPEPLSGFLSQLRHQLDPRFRGKPHLTLLPPRPLVCSSDDAWADVRREIRRNSSFLVDLGSVGVFAESQVVFLSIRHGASEIEQLHGRLNTGRAGFAEVWRYHPHVTLAHGLFGGDFTSAATEATRCWGLYQGVRQFRVERLVWVKTTIVPGSSGRGTRSMVATDSEWVDLGYQDLV